MTKDDNSKFSWYTLLNHRVLRDQRTVFMETCLVLPPNSQDIH